MRDLRMKKQAAILVVLSSTLSLIAGCANPKPFKPAPGTPGVSTDTPAPDAKAGDKAPNAASSDAPVKMTPAHEQLPQLAEAQEKIDLQKMPDTLTICMVGTAPITIGDYRREFKMQEEQARAQFGSNPAMLQQLLESARKDGLALTDPKRKG